MNLGQRLSLAAAALAVVAVLNGCDHACECAGAWADITLDVDGADGKQLSGVVVTFDGPASSTMTCEPGGSGGGVVCRWPNGPVVAGDYSLRVSATGYERGDFTATMTVTEPPVKCTGCCCEHASLDHTRVTLTPAH